MVGGLNLPVFCECSTYVKCCFIPSSIKFLWNIFLGKCVPLYVPTTSRILSRVNMFVLKNLVKFVDVIFVNGSTSIHFVK